MAWDFPPDEHWIFRLSWVKSPQEKQMATTYDVIIIGSGPAGYTAALYAARANLSVLMFRGLESGGQLMLTSDVENYPGFEDGILGPDLMEHMEKQARRFGAEMRDEDVIRLDTSVRPFKVYPD